MKYDLISEAYLNMLTEDIFDAKQFAKQTFDIESLLQSKKIHEKAAALYHKDINDSHIKRLLSEPSMALRTRVFSPVHDYITPSNISNGLKDKAYQVKMAAISHPNANKENIHEALNDSDERVRKLAVKHQNADNIHIEKGLSDKHLAVRQAASMHPNMNSENIIRALRDPHASVRLNAIYHQNVTPEHIGIAVMDKNLNVANAAISHPLATKDQILKALTVKRLGSNTNKLTAFDKHPRFKEYFPNGILE